MSLKHKSHEHQILHNKTSTTRKYKTSFNYRSKSLLKIAGHLLMARLKISKNPLSLSSINFLQLSLSHKKVSDLKVICMNGSDEK